MATFSGIGLGGAKKMVSGKGSKSPLAAFQEDAAKKEEAERARMGDLIGTQFSQARNVLGAARDVGREQLEEDLSRRAMISGQTTGAQEKIRRKALTELARGFGQEAAGLEAQEAAARQQAEEGTLGRAFGREQLGLQESQFARTMQLQQAEFRENLKTNFINTAIALKEAGLKSADDWKDLLSRDYGFLSQFSPSHAPGVFSGGQNQPGVVFQPRTVPSTTRVGYRI